MDHGSSNSKQALADQRGSRLTLAAGVLAAALGYFLFMNGMLAKGDAYGYFTNLLHDSSTSTNAQSSNLFVVGVGVFVVGMGIAQIFARRTAGMMLLGIICAIIAALLFVSIEYPETPRPQQRLLANETLLLHTGFVTASALSFAAYARVMSARKRRRRRRALPT